MTIVILFALLALTGILLVIPYVKIEDGNPNVKSVSVINSTDTDDKNNSLLISDTSNDTSIKTIDYIFDLSSKNETFERAIYSKKFAACFSMAFCSSCNIIKI
jgi:hypothetical protein